MMFDIRKIQEQVIFNAVKNASDDKTAAQVVYGENGQASAEDNAAWVKATMLRLETRFDRPVVKQIRMNCQCGYGMDEKLQLVKELVESSCCMEEFASQDRAKAAGLTCVNGELYLQFGFCPCPMLAEVDRLKTDTWCQCTTGYSKVLFEKAFGCEVDVELLKSIKMGDEICLMKIIPSNSVWGKVELEKMDDFFTARVEGYDEHMLTNVNGCKEAYTEMARLIPKSCKALLDLGCGTGLELDEIFKLLPDLTVTGIDITQAMLDKLRQKHSDKAISLICGSYFDVGLGVGEYDCAVSFQTMHHFSHDAKIGLYRRIYNALNKNGIYIECDYMVESQEEEEFYYAENARIRKEMNIPEDEFYHYDTPCTVENQLKMLQNAGFTKVGQVFRIENTTIIIASR